jgi:hypothetical protein
MHGLDLLRTAHVPGAAAVFVVQEHDEIGVRGEVVERTFDQFLDRAVRRQPLEVKLALLGADFLVHPFQYRKVERVLVAEVMIHQLLVHPGTGGDVVDPRAGEAVRGEFAPRRRQQLLARGSGIAALRPGAV